MIIVLISVFGLVVGSFLNVVMYRYPSPLLMSKAGRDFRFGSPSRSKGAGDARPKYILGGRSLCPFCKKQLRWFELIPLASFIIQKRRCRGCQALISWQYPAVEFGTAAAFALIAWQYVNGTL